MALQTDEVTDAVPGLYRYALSLSRDPDSVITPELATRLRAARTGL